VIAVKLFVMLLVWIKTSLACGMSLSNDCTRTLVSVKEIILYLFLDLVEPTYVRTANPLVSEPVVVVGGVDPPSPETTTVYILSS